MVRFWTPYVLPRSPPTPSGDKIQQKRMTERISKVRLSERRSSNWILLSALPEDVVKLLHDKIEGIGQNAVEAKNTDPELVKGIQNRRMRTAHICKQESKQIQMKRSHYIPAWS